MTDFANNLPLSGSVIVAGLLYAGISAFITGPLIADRLIETSGWDTLCQQTIKRDMLSRREITPVSPSAKCNRMLFFMGRDGQELCGLLGNPDFAPLLDPLADQKRRLREAKNKRLETLAAKSGSRCSCAVSTTFETKRLSFALYAGSARIVEPNAIKNLHAALSSNLHAPICAGFAAGGR